MDLDINLGDSNINFKYWITVVGIIIISNIISLILRRILSRTIRLRSKHIKVDPTKFVFLKNSVSFVIFTIAIIVIFMITPSLKDIGKGLFAGAGILAATIGLASQKAFSNILSGIFILIFKPFGVNDIIEVKGEGQKGIVEEITLRHTMIRDYEHRRIIIPNSLISETTIVNSSIIDSKIRKHINIGISYDSDISLAKKIIEEEIVKHRLFLDVRTEKDKKNGIPPILIRLISLSDSSVEIRAYVWAATNDEAFDLQCDVLESIKRRFDIEGVEIPFPHRTLYFKNKPVNIQDRE